MREATSVPARAGPICSAPAMPIHDSDIGAQIERGAYRDAEIRIRALLGKEPGADEPLYELELRTMLAQVLFRLGRTEEALEESDLVIKRLTENGVSGSRAPAAAELRYRAVAISADALARLDRDDEAEKRASAARSDADKTLGAVNLPSAHLSQVMGSIMLERGDLDGALRELTRALEIRDKLNESPTLDLSVTLGELAVVCRKRGDLHRARRHLERAHSIKEKLLGSEHPDLAKSFNSLALLGVEEGADRQSVEALFVRAIAHAERGGPTTARDLGVYLINLGSFYRTEGRLLDARSAFERGTAVRERSWGNDHRNTAIARYHLGSVLFELGQIAEARAALGAAKAALEARPKTSEYARTVLLLGRVLLGEGELQEANQLFDRAWLIRKELYGEENRETRLAESYCARALALRGGVAEAVARAKAASELERRQRVEPSQTGAQLIANYGLVLRERGARRKAVRVLREALTRLECAIGAGHPESVETMISLGTTLSELGRLDEAEALLALGSGIRREASNGQHRALAGHELALGQVRARQGRWEEAYESFRVAILTELRAATVPPIEWFETFEYSGQMAERLDDVDATYSTVLEEGLERTSPQLAATVRIRRALSRSATAVLTGSFAEEFDRAVVDLRSAVVGREKALGSHDPATVEARALLNAAEGSRAAERPIGSLAEQLAHLEGTKPRRVLFNMSTLVISLFLFILSVGSGFSREGLILLVGVLLLHELGHLLAMWLFRYRNLSILFLPFLGAVAVGRRRQPTQFQRVMVYLAGPVPGVVLGLALYALYMRELKPEYAKAASVLFLVNGFNLLPLMPLDGGRVVNDLLLERRPRAAALFGIAGGVILSCWGWQSGSAVLLVYGALCAIPLLFGYRERIFQGRILRATRDELKREPGERPDEGAMRRAILRVFRPLELRQRDALYRYRIAHGVIRVLRMPASGFMTVAALVATYLLWLAIAIAFASALGRKGAFVENRVMQLVDSGQLDEAIRIAADNAEQGVLRSSTEAGLFELARIHRSKGRLEEAERTLLDLLARMGADTPDDTGRVEHAVVLIELAEVQRDRGNRAQAEEVLERAVGLLEQQLGRESDETIDAKEKLLDLYVRGERWDAAEPLAEQLLAWLKSDSGLIRSKVDARAQLVAKSFVARMRCEDARPLLTMLLERQLEAFNGADNGILWTLRALGDCEAALNHPAEAERAYKDFHRHLLAVYGTGSAEEIQGLYALGHFYARRGFYPPAERQLRKAFVLAQTVYGVEHAELIPILEELEFALKGLRNDAEAAEIKNRREQLLTKLRAKEEAARTAPAASGESDPASQDSVRRDGGKRGKEKR